MSKIIKESIIRWIFTIILLIFIWLGYKWALYLLITFITIGLEITQLLLNKYLEENS